MSRRPRALPRAVASFVAVRFAGAAVVAAVGTFAPGAARAEAASDAHHGAGLEDVTVTARRREERAQDVPIAVSVLGGEALEASGTASFAQVAQLVPTVQLISSNPRNTSVTIRGLGSSFGLTNDGLEPGVGVYVDEVYNSRPAAATFDLIDVERLEVLRGPQGTLFGKNTTAGAIHLTTRAPSFTPESRVLVSGGTKGWLSAQASISGPLVDPSLAGRVSIASTRRDGVLDNVTTGAKNNEQRNRAIRAQLLYAPTDRLTVRAIGDFNRQDLDQCCTQVYVRYGATLRPAAQQFPALAAGIGYAPASLDPYDRKSDVDSPLQADQRIGGASVHVRWDGPVRLESITSWRFWRWRPLNDRDLTRLSILTQSQNASDQRQWTQELRVSGRAGTRVDYTAGVYAFRATVDTFGATAYGADASYWLLPAGTPAALLDGYRADFTVGSSVESRAVYAQADWQATERVRITPGVRYTDERKAGAYDQRVSGGLPTTNTTLLSRRAGIQRAQSYGATFSDGSTTGQLSASHEFAPDTMAYATVARGYKSGGINLNGLPVDAAGNPALTQAVVKPERVRTYELGLKSRVLDGRAAFDVAAFRTDVRDYQTNVVDTGPGALRGYLANADRVRVQGVELEGKLRPADALSLYASVAYTDSEYVEFRNAPCPLERLGASTTPCDVSGGPLPAVSRWAASAGAEVQWSAGERLGGELYVAVDGQYRSSFSSDASNSVYARVNPYALVNVRAGYRASDRWDAFLFVRNALDRNYLQFLSIQPGNSGAIFGQPGDPRTAGLTVRWTFGGT